MAWKRLPAEPAREPDIEEPHCFAGRDGAAKQSKPRRDPSIVFLSIADIFTPEPAPAAL